MFDMTVDDEKSLLGELLRRTGIHPDNSCVIDGDGIWMCPKCHEGEIRTACYVERHNGELRSWRYEHRCDKCGEAFGINTLQADIRLRSPFDALKSLETPFGRFHALANDNELPVRHRVVNHDLGEGYGEIQFHEIDVDISGCSVGDIARCRFEDAHLEFIGGDERVEYQCGVNSEHAIVISGYNPEFDIYRGANYAKELEKYYPYDLYRQTTEGFDYAIQRDPQGYDAASYYRSRFIQLGAAWVPKPYESFTFDDELGLELGDQLSLYL